MTWFYNMEGLAKGPLDESGIMNLITDGTINAQTLIWHNGMDLWSEAGSLNPSWWQPVLPNSRNADETVVSASGLSHRTPIPLAPTEASPKTQPEGLFKRLFGGKKKST